MLPSLFPLFDYSESKLIEGGLFSVCAFCQKAVKSKPECQRHYQELKQKPPGYYQCPFGFTSRSFYFNGHLNVITGIIAYPRFNTKPEMEMAKKFPDNKVTRENIDGNVRCLEDIDKSRANALQESAKILPQAFHELRKLNREVLQHAEKETKYNQESRNLHVIRSAAELMRNNFDILEALTNIEGMKALPSESTINIYDLVYKLKMIYAERASSANIQIFVSGIRAIIRGSLKSFPIVPAVLLENAIKYGTPYQTITANISVLDAKAVLTVENKSDLYIDTIKCFEKGLRFSGSIEGSGFGLYLAKEIIIAHGGTVQCVKSGDLIRFIAEFPLYDVIEFKS